MRIKIEIELTKEQYNKLEYIIDDLSLSKEEILKEQIIEYIEGYDYE